MLNIKKIIREYRIPLVLSILLLIFHTTSYCLAKFTPFEVTIVGGRLDSLIPLSPPWVIFYVIWYVLLIITACYLYKVSKPEFYSYIAIKFIIDIISSFIFIFYPTLFNRPELVVNDIFTWILNFIYLNDTPALNCLPSMHCTVCFISIYTVFKSNKITNKCKAFAMIIFMFIVFSTLFVKQHAVVDVIAALILTIIVSLFVYNFKLDKKLEKKIEKSR